MKLHSYYCYTLPFDRNDFERAINTIIWIINRIL